MTATTSTSVATATTAAQLRERIKGAREEGLSVGFVPTMGALHDGHGALIAASAAANDFTVVSIFVNPTQFNDATDLADYPRTEDADIDLAAGAGASLCFLPSVEEIYPQGNATTVSVRGPLTESLEGAERGPGHFDGVCTVVAKLLALTAPDVAYFGDKDAQQLRVVRRMTGDLKLPVRIESVGTVRAPDGLALSSRNARIFPADRQAALSLSRALATVGKAIVAGTVETGGDAERLGMELLRDGGSEPEYFAAVDPESFEPDASPGPQTLLLCAARVDGVRLIDNMIAGFAAQFNAEGDHERGEC